ncbi:CHAT domain-containing protein [Streptomyces sp. cmx-18-6]|uniref:CHAT domain-containing protein n=1 Tax=Streptomyces sp. cmx-18-6 TaxID=2790930 RepID=UPI00397F3186
MGKRRESDARGRQLAAGRALIQRVAAEDDPSAGLSPEVLNQAVRLTELVRKNPRDLDVRLAAGWLHWLRHQALPVGERQADFSAAVMMLIPCFIEGVGPLPEPLTPVLADACAPHAAELVQQALVSTDPDPGVVQGILELWRRIADGVPAAHRHRTMYLSNLSGALMLRFSRTSSVADLDEAIAVGRRAAGSRQTADHPDRAMALSNLGNALCSRFEVTGSKQDLDAAIEAGRAAVATVPRRHPSRSDYLGNLGRALLVRFEHCGRFADLDAAVSTMDEAARTAPHDHPGKALFLSNLVRVLRLRFEHTKSAADLDAAIRATRNAVRITPTGHSEQGWQLSSLAQLLRMRFDHSGDVKDLNAAINAARDATEASRSSPSPVRAGRLCDLGNALVARYQRENRAEDLTTAIHTLKEAMGISPTHDPNRALYMTSLGGALGLSFERTNSTDDLNAAIAFHEKAAEFLSPTHPDYGMQQCNLGDALRLRFEHSGNPADLDGAITSGRNAVLSVAASGKIPAVSQSNLGIALRLRFEHGGDIADLDAAISTCRSAVESTPVQHPEYGTYLTNLGIAQRCHYQATGSRRLLDAAVESLENAVEAIPPHHANRAGYLINLAGVLQERYESTGTTVDLHDAILAIRAALTETSHESPYRARYLHNLSGALQLRFRRTGLKEDIDFAIESAREVAGTSPHDHFMQVFSLNTLGVSLKVRYEHSGELSDINAAVRAHRRALKLSDSDHPNHPMFLSNLSDCLRLRFENTRRVLDLDEAVDVSQLAVHTTPADHPGRADRLCGLGAALYERSDHVGDVSDSASAEAAYLEAARSEAATPGVRIRAAREAARILARHDTARASDVLEDAVLLLPQLAPRDLDRSDQQRHLGLHFGLASEAASLALSDERGTPESRAARALRLLEAGRGVLLAQTLDIRTDLRELQQRNPGVAQRYMELKDRLEHSAGTTIAEGTGVNAQAFGAARQSKATTNRRRLVHDLERVLEEIRSMSGFASFGLPPDLDELLAVTHAGPVAIFNVSPHRSDVLLLAQGEVSSIRLAEFGYDAVIAAIDSFQEALRNSASGRSRALRKDAQAELVKILEWLWDSAAQPVLDALGFRHSLTDEDEWPRMWWVPGGILGLLPIHAAGYHTDPLGNPARRSVIDRVVSGYAPTVRALLHSLRQVDGRVAKTDPFRALIVSMPTTPGLADEGTLHHIEHEVSLVQKQFPRHALLQGSGASTERPHRTPPLEATKVNVLAHLPECQIAHFACHGASHPTDPSKSLLLLQDYQHEPFDVASLSAISLKGVELAYLSACRTAAIDAVELLDEAVQLSVAFQLAGFPHVIGTLWAIDDECAAVVADSFYSQLKTGPDFMDVRRAPFAWHAAVRQVRDRLPRTPSLWASYMYAGA